jgi:hypothetical protein
MCEKFVVCFPDRVGIYSIYGNALIIEDVVKFSFTLFHFVHVKNRQSIGLSCGNGVIRIFDLNTKIIVKTIYHK